MQDDSGNLRRIREGIVLRHVAAEADGDAEGVVATFSRPRYDLVAPGTILDGPEAVRQRVLDLAAAMPGCEICVTHMHHADDSVIVETETTGIHTSELLAAPATGNRYKIRGVAIFRFERTDLVEETVYFDRMTLMEQLQPSSPRA